MMKLPNPENRSAQKRYNRHTTCWALSVITGASVVVALVVWVCIMPASTLLVALITTVLFVGFVGSVVALIVASFDLYPYIQWGQVIDITRDTRNEFHAFVGESGVHISREDYDGELYRFQKAKNAGNGEVTEASRKHAVAEAVRQFKERFMDLYGPRIVR